MSSLQWCLPMVQGRGAGLGNELVPWARSYLMSRVLGAACLSPAFGLNHRRYWHHFGTSRLDWIWHRAMLRSLPRIRFDEADYLAHGGGDVSEAFTRFVDAKGLRDRSPLVVVTDGLWGGMRHIERAREFVRATLYGSRNAAANLSELAARLDPERLTVAMHVRLGDFDSAASMSNFRGRFNCSLPIEWFIGIGRQLKAAFGDDVQFQIFSDGSAAQLAPLTDVLSPVDTACSLPADVSDLLAMASADLLVCSLSSYSVWAATLSKAPYVWFEPQMYEHGAGWLSIWGHEAQQQTQDGMTQQALQRRRSAGGAHSQRAEAVDGNGRLPAALLRRLEQRMLEDRRDADLVRYGVVRPADTVLSKEVGVT